MNHRFTTIAKGVGFLILGFLGMLSFNVASCTYRNQMFLTAARMQNEAAAVQQQRQQQGAQQVSPGHIEPTEKK